METTMERRLARARADADLARQSFERAVVEARDAGLQWRRIATATGMGIASVHDIARKRRSAS